MTRALGITLCIIAMCATGCASSQKPASPLTKVKQNSIRGIEHLAAEARRITETDYPRIRALLGAETDCPPFSIGFRKQLWIPYEGPGSGVAKGRNINFRIAKRTFATYRQRTIELSAERLRARPERLGEVVHHEITHFFQHYPTNTPSHWREGIADYVAHELAAEKSHCACNAMFPALTDGYACAAAFLQFLHDAYTTNTVPRLHQALSKGKSAEAFFHELTGREFSDLWTEFQSTSRYTPDARAAVTLREKVDATKSPDDAVELLQAFLSKRPGGEITVSAMRHVKTLADAKKIPAPPSRQFAIYKDELDQSPTFPARRIVHFDSHDNKTRYDYHLAKDSPATEWTLEKILLRDLRTGKIKSRPKSKPRN